VKSGKGVVLQTPSSENFSKLYAEIMHSSAKFSLGYKNASSQWGHTPTRLHPELPLVVTHIHQPTWQFYLIFVY